MRLSIRSKFAMALGLLAVCVLTVGISSVVVVRFNETALNDLQQQRLRSLLLARDAQASLRRYIKDVEVAVSTKDSDLLDADDAMIAEMRAWVAEVRLLERAPDPAFDERVADLVSSCKTYVHQMTSGEAGAVGMKTGQHASDLRAVLVEDLQGLAQRAKDNFEDEVRKIGAFNQQATKLSLLLVTVLTIATVGLSGAILATVLRRIRKLGEHFAGTDLEKITPLVTSVGGRDELAELVDAANRMLLGIRESRRQLVGIALLDSVLEALVDVLVVVDSAGNVVRVNHACERLLGTIPGGHVGSRFSGWLVPGDRPNQPDPESLLRSVARGATVSVELSLRTADGGLVPVHLLGAPLAGGAADTASAVFVARDLRAKLADEAHMQQVQAQLVQASKLASLGTLGAGVAHELNNPLAAVRGYAALLASANAVPAPEQALASKIVKASDRMRKIIDHLRIFAADSSHRDKRAIDLNVIVHDSLILLQNQIASGGITVEVALAPDLAPIFADANQVESVIQNLIINSRDALAEVTDARTRQIRVSSALAANRREVSVTVRDNANGIPVHVQPRVFDPFYTTKEVGKGTGLGLSIAHGIAKDHGGDLSFTTESGAGTAFTVTFPVAEAATYVRPEPPVPVPAPPIRNHGPKAVVVIIDDEPDIGDVLMSYLGEAFSTEYFADPILALVRLERPYDLVITDMKMPAMSGLDVIRKLRVRDPAAKILLVTGHAQTEDEVVQALAEGAAGVIPKPFPSVEEMCRQVQEALSRTPETLLTRAS